LLDAVLGLTLLSSRFAGRFASFLRGWEDGRRGGREEERKRGGEEERPRNQEPLKGLLKALYSS
jgi:hypothetical protein